jgi:hypothetical protein
MRGLAPNCSEGEAAAGRGPFRVAAARFRFCGRSGLDTQFLYLGCATVKSLSATL